MSESSDRIPAFAYLRVSGKGQLDGDGFPRQREAIERYAAVNGYEIVRWFEERGESGTLEWEDRPAWSEMVAAFNGTRTIIVEKLDRMARSNLVQELIIRDLKKLDVRLLSAAGDDSDDDQPERVMLRQLLGIFAEYERKMIVIKLRGARNRKKHANGRCEGRKPYGHYAGESSVLERMLTMRSDGCTCEQIAAALNSSGIQTRHGKKWQVNGVAKIVRRAK